MYGNLYIIKLCFPLLGKVRISIPSTKVKSFSSLTSIAEWDCFGVETDLFAFSLIFFNSSEIISDLG